MGKNVPLLRKIANWAYGEWLKSERGEWSEWDQSVYLAKRNKFDKRLYDVSLWDLENGCGTVCCIAGKTALEVSSLRFERSSHVGGLDIVGDYDEESSLSIREIATQALGLNYNEAGHLFSANNNIYDVYAIMNVFTNGEITPPHEIEEHPWYKETKRRMELGE